MNVAAAVRYHKKHNCLPTDAAASVTPHVDRVCYEWQRYPIKIRHVLKAFVISRRNQPPRKKSGEWQCQECGTTSVFPFEPGCFIEAVCPVCGVKTEHSGVLM